MSEPNPNRVKTRLKEHQKRMRRLRFMIYAFIPYMSIVTILTTWHIMSSGITWIQGVPAFVIYALALGMWLGIIRRAFEGHYLLGDMKGTIETWERAREILPEILVELTAPEILLLRDDMNEKRISQGMLLIQGRGRT